MTRKILLLSCLLIFPAAVFSNPALPERGGNDQSDITLHIRPNGDVGLTANQVPVQQIIERIRQHSKIALHYASLPEQLMTVSCRGPIVEILRCVLGDSANLMLRYGENAANSLDSKFPEEIWILGSDDRRTGSAPQDAATPCSPIESTMAVSADEPDHGPDFQGKSAFQRQQQTEQLLGRSRSRDVRARKQAITRLASTDTGNEDEILGTIQAALSDRQATVRAQAISTLAARDAAETPEILRRALLDPDAEVRLMALDHAGQDEALLLTALDDPDPNVRTLANLKLEQLYRQDAEPGR